MITARQQQVLDALAEAQAAGQPCPSFDELGRRLGISRQGIAGHLQALERKGLIVRDPAAHRAIRVVAKSQPTGERGNVLIM